MRTIGRATQGEQSGIVDGQNEVYDADQFCFYVFIKHV